MYVSRKCVYFFMIITNNKIIIIIIRNISVITFVCLYFVSLKIKRIENNNNKQLNINVETTNMMKKQNR